MPNRYTSQKISLATILKWQLSKRFSPRSIPYTPMPIEYHSTLPEGEYALWLGHATLWLCINGTTVAIDPVLGDIPLYRRHTPIPLPKEVLKSDLILITHAHYDHFDKPSVLTLLKNNPKAIIVAPIGFWRYVKGVIEREKCFELEWWESVMIGGLFITLTPAKHWSKRTPFDTNKALWGVFIIQNHTHCIYHSGDSAEGDHFKEIGERFDIDEAFLPIGAYRPEPIMRHNHLNPPQALQAAIDLRAKTMLPIHYGTFHLSDEPLDEPLAWFEQLIAAEPYPFEAKVLQIGEVYRFNEMSTLTST